MRASPTVAGLIRPARLRDANNKILHKRFPGGALKLVGANSPAGLASWPAKRIMLDEVDRYPASAGDEGDPVALVKKRAQTYLRRGGKLLAGSTPDIAGLSLIESLVEQGDKRVWLVPCHHCGHGQRLEFERVVWDKPAGRHLPSTAAYHCAGCGAGWGDIDRLANVARGRWEPTGPASSVRSYLIDGLLSPDVTHGEMAREWLAATTDERRKVFVNTYLGRTWSEESDAPDWKDLARRREAWPRGVLPDGVLMLCCGVDVQKNRLEYRVWGFGRGDRGGEAWLVEGDVIPAGPDDPAAWEAVEALLERTWTAASGEPMRLDRLAVDSGAFTEEVYGWGRHHRFDERVMLVKGDARQALVVGPRQVQEWSPTGKKARFGVAVTIVGTNRAKDYLLRKLRLAAPLPGEATPAGYVHLPGWAPDEELRQLVAERKVRRVNRRGYVEQVWTKTPGERNEALDALVYAYAAACSAGLWSAPASFWARREEAYGPRPKGPGTGRPAAPVPSAERLAELFAPRVMRSDDPFLE